MTFPSFFAAVPTIVMRDRLAEFLGAAAGGLIEYGYADAVKLAGHSCPTVAGSYLLSSRALQALYPDEIPLRGELRVDFRDAQESAVTGVVAAVVGLLTGAAGIGGFKGLAGRFSRRELLSFGAELPGEIRFTRQDKGQSLLRVAAPRPGSCRLQSRAAAARAARGQGRCRAGSAVCRAVAGSPAADP
jgi:hypothetical protein